MPRPCGDSVARTPRFPSLSFRGTAVAVACLALLGGLAGCSDGKDSSADGGGTTSTTTPQVRFTPCLIHKSLDTMDRLPNPTTAQEGRQSVRFLVDLYTAIADAAPPERADAAAELRTAMANLQQEAASQNYSGAFLNGAPKALQTVAFLKANDQFTTDYATACGTATTATTPTTATSGG